MIGRSSCLERYKDWSLRLSNKKNSADFNKSQVLCYEQFVESFVRRTYTIGGEIIFPKHVNSMNQRKGCHQLIGDRWDLTLECIRRYYIGEDSPLFSTIQADKAFYDLFVDFKGYVDFFFLQDCVTEDYKTVRIWQGKGDFSENPYPQSVEQYLRWIDNQLDFTAKRNQRIAEACGYDGR